MVLINSHEIFKKKVTTTIGSSKIWSSIISLSMVTETQQDFIDLFQFFALQIALFVELWFIEWENNFFHLLDNALVLLVRLLFVQLTI